MPCIKIFTNLQKSRIPSGFAQKLLPVLVQTVKKPAENFIVTISTDCIQSMGEDTTCPSIVASLESIGHLGPAENKFIAKEVTDFFVKELGVDRQQVFLTFYDLAATDVAKNGVTIG